MQTSPVETETPATLAWWGITDCGKVRRNNEDAFLCLQFDAREFRFLGKIGEDSNAANDFVFAVSDGMGGANAGEFASRIAVEKITRLLPRAFKAGAQGLHPGYGDVLGELFDQIHRALLYVGSAYEECRGMGATLTLAWFMPRWMAFAHIGDSRAYYLPADGSPLKQLSHDDTHVGWLLRNGKISEREARQHPRRTALQRALGAGNQFVEPQVGAVGFQPGDRFLLCTDGVVDGLFDADIERLIRRPDAGEAVLNPAQRIVASAVERSGRDNTTALVIEVR